MFIAIGLIWSSFVIWLISYIYRNKESHIDKYVLYSSIYLLTYKSIELIYNLIIGNTHKIPIDYSAIMYFLLSLTIIFNIKQTKLLTFFGSFLSGLGYMITFSISGSLIYNHALFLLIMALFNHSVLFFIGALMMTKQMFTFKDAPKVILSTLIIVSYVFLINNIVDFSVDRFLIIDLLYGNIFGFDVISNKFLYYLVNYIFVISLYLLVFYIYTLINRLVYKEYHLQAKQTNEIFQTT